VLRTLRRRCGEGPDRVANEAVNSQDDLRKHGINQSLLTILQNTARSIPATLQARGCAQFMAAYVIVIEQGK
jgi:hypothetical protein